MADMIIKKDSGIELLYSLIAAGNGEKLLHKLAFVVKELLIHWYE